MVLPTKMHAVLLKGHGGLDQLEYRTDVTVPTPADDEVLIQVSAAGVNNTDINTVLVGTRRQMNKLQIQVVLMVLKVLAMMMHLGQVHLLNSHLFKVRIAAEKSLQSVKM